MRDVAAVLPAKQRVTPREYLAAERLADAKSEFFDGEVFSMAGGTHNHSLIAVNFVTALRGALRGGPCYPLNSDMRLKVEATGLYSYPDLQVVCGSARFEDERNDTLLNPTVIAEVLSPSTAAWDRGQKFWNYRHIDSLQQYVLISTDRRLVEIFTRQPNGAWLLDTFEGAGGRVALSSIQCEVPLDEVYLGVEFDAPT